MAKSKTGLKKKAVELAIVSALYFPLRFLAAITYPRDLGGFDALIWCFSLAGILILVGWILLAAAPLASSLRRRGV
jgi:hypothetical protein